MKAPATLLALACLLPLLVQAKPAAAMKIASPDFSEGGMIPARFTCDGANVNPRLDIAGVPAGARSLVLMDLHMPEVDGFMATREIRRREKSGRSGGRTFICALTANVMKRDRDACMDVGMDHILAKPLRADDLAEVLRKIQPASN